MSKKPLILAGSVFYLFFLLLTPLGLFNDWIPPLKQTGYYSLATIDGGDDTGYYAFLRSGFFDGDFDFINELNYSHSERFNGTGYAWTNWQLGQGILYLPFFLAGHLLARLYGVLGYPVSADGYSDPYYLATALASATWLFAGLLLLMSALRKFFSEKTAWAASIAVWLGSPLVYYTFVRSRMAHTTEFAFAALFLLVWLNLRESENKWHHALMGACLGFLCLIRLINLSYVVLYAADLLLRCWVQRGSMDSAKLKNTIQCVAGSMGMFLILLLPQFMVWDRLNGFIISPYIVGTVLGHAESASAGGSFAKVFDVFFSPRWGMLYSAPLWFLGLCGLLVKGSAPGGVRLPALLSVAGLLVILLSFVESDAYGNRYLIPGAAVFALGLGVLLDRCEKWPAAWWTAVSAIVVCVLVQYLMIAQYKVTLNYDDPRFSLEALANLARVLTDQPGLLLRSTNIFSLLRIDHPEAWDYRDYLFMVLFPLGQFLCLVLTGALVMYFVRPEARVFLTAAPWRKVVGLAGAGFILTLLVSAAAPRLGAEEIEARKNYRDLMVEGDRLFSQGKIEAARAAYVRASEIEPNLWHPYYKAGWTWYVEAKFPESEKYMQRALAIHPQHPGSLFAYGDGLQKTGRVQEAEKYLRTALRVIPTSEHVYDALGQVYGKQGMSEKAIAFFYDALRVNPNFGQAHVNLAVIYTIMKDGEHAVPHLVRAIGLGAKGPMVEKLVLLYGQEAPEPKG